MSGTYLLFVARVTVLAGTALLFSAGLSKTQAERAPRPMVALVEKDNDRTVAIRLGDILQVTLPENATTGYRWAIDSYDEDLVKALANQPRYPAQAIGSGGEVAFTFEAKKIGSGEIVLKHFRHWEGDASINQRFRVIIRVQP